MPASKPVWSYGLVKTFTNRGVQPAPNGKWSYGLLVELFEYVVAADVPASNFQFTIMEEGRSFAVELESSNFVSMKENDDFIVR